MRSLDLELSAASAAREAALPGCREVIRLCGSAITSIHRLRLDDAREGLGRAGARLAEVQAVLAPFPEVEHGGFLHDAEKEYVEGRAVLAFVEDTPVPDAAELGVGAAAWLRGLAEAASELRRHLLDRLRDGEVERAEHLLGTMDDVYDLLLTVDHPDAITHGLRRTLDALRAVLERSRSDLTMTVVQARALSSIDAAVAGRDREA